MKHDQIYIFIFYILRSLLAGCFCWRVHWRSLGWKQGGSQEVRNDEAGRGGQYASPTSSVFHIPMLLHMLFPLPTTPFPPSPSEKFHRVSFHRLLSVSHTSSTLMPKHDNLPCLPLISIANGSLSLCLSLR